MIKEIDLKTIYINKTAPSGAPLINKKDQPYIMVNIESIEGMKASMYIGQFNGAWDKKLDIVSNWKQGDLVKVNIEENGQYLNFSLPTKTDELEVRVEKLETALFGSKATESHNVPQTPPNNNEQGQEVDPTDISKIPF